MDERYFNYSTYFAGRAWERRAFMKGWQRIYATDPRWVALHRRQRKFLLHPEQDPYLGQTVVAQIRLEALPRRKRAGGVGGVLWEEAVAAAVLCVDRTPKGRIGRLALLHCANDEETVDRLIGVAQEEFWHHGCQSIIGPTGLSPHLQNGLLTNYFHVTPPLHTPYNPPYLPELMATTLRPLRQTSLFHRALTEEQNEAQPAVDNRNTGSTPIVSRSDFKLHPLSPAVAQSAEFLELWQSAVLTDLPVPPPDLHEISFLWQWLTVWPWAGWVAMVGSTPVGFVLLQPDLAEQCRIARGGQNPLWALWLHWRQQRHVRNGRIVFGAVLPEWRNQGVGSTLWAQTMTHARQQAWQTLTIGPLPANGAGASFLLKRGAQRQQVYQLFGNEG